MAHNLQDMAEIPLCVVKKERTFGGTFSTGSPYEPFHPEQKKETYNHIESDLSKNKENNSVSVNETTYILKTEPNTTEEPWLDKINGETMQTLSMRTQSKESYETKGHGASVKSFMGHDCSLVKEEPVSGDECLEVKKKHEPKFSQPISADHGCLVVKEESISIDETLEVKIENGALPVLKEEINQRPHMDYHAESYNLKIPSSSSTKDLSIHNTRERPFKCAQCQKSFMRNNRLKKHMLIHKNETFKCKVCGKDCTQKSLLAQHMRVHTGERPFNCEECGKAFKCNRDVITHQKTHSGKKSFKCSLCDHSFIQNCALIVHMRIHTGIKPYKCPQCGKSFRHKSACTYHMQSHRDERPYKCNHCGKVFKTKPIITKHVKTHIIDRPYNCPRCKKSFKEKRDLKRHLKTHCAEKPYKCLQCGKQYRRIDHFVAHKRNHTGENP